jgi:hypothetical protein
MSSNVIGQQNGTGVYTFTNIDNQYGGATTELLRLDKEGVTVSAAAAFTGTVSFAKPVAPSVKTLSLASGDTAASLTIDADVVLVNNANSSSCTVTVADGSIVGAVAHVVCTGTGTVVFSGPTGSGAGLTITAKGGLTLVCGSDLEWYQIGVAA